MKLEHSFRVAEDVDTAWDVLNDVRKVALCMPGAAVDTVDGNDITGTCKIKLGPIALTYRGQATFVERDATAHRMVLEGNGQDGANGRAAVTVVASLSADGDQTRVDLQTDLKLTGKPAQFGRGMIADVGGKIIEQFSACLSEKLAVRVTEPESEAAGEPAASAASAEAEAEPLDLVHYARHSALKRVGPLVAAAMLVLLIGALVRRLRSRD